MKDTKQKNRADLVQRIATATDHTTADFQGFHLVGMADELLKLADTARAKMIVAGQAGGYGMDHLNRAKTALGSLHHEDLGAIIVSHVLETSPEVADAREKLRPLMAQLAQAERDLAAHDEEAAAVRRAIEDKLAEAEHRAKNDPALLKLKEELSALG